MGTDQFTSYRRRYGLRHYFVSLETGDSRLTVSVLFLVVIGWIMVYSATSNESGASMLLKQVGVGLAGLILMLALSYLDYHVLLRLSSYIYVLALMSIFLVKIPGIGVYSNGAYRWVQLGPVQFQPSELMKPALILLLAYLFDTMGRNIEKGRAAIVSFAPGVLAAAIIYTVTTNLSTALIVVGIMLVMFFIAYPNRKIWTWIAGIFVAMLLLWLAYFHFSIVPQMEQIRSGAETSGSFRAGRILAWLYPDEFLDTSMQSRYSLYAIGYGGLLGRGLGHGTVKNFLPECENDFIFAVIGEELGIVGCAMVIFLYGYLIWRIMVIAQHAPDRSGRYVAAGIGVHISLQTILNIGVATSLFPNTGISLPFISYGGTALLIQLLEMGVVLNISRQIPGKMVAVDPDEPARQDEDERRRRNGTEL